MPEQPPVPVPERVVNVALGLSVLSWAVLGFVRADPVARASLVRITITALNLCVGALFFYRGAVLQHAPPRDLLLCLPSLAITGVSLKLAAPPAAWPLGASVLFAAGGLVAIASLATLGRSFALLPALRGIVTRGPYRAIRHPAYAGEFAMIAACALASPRPWLAWPVAATGAALLALRITIEERLLTTSAAYSDYAARVRFRILPGLW